MNEYQQSIELGRNRINRYISLIQNTGKKIPSSYWEGFLAGMDEEFPHIMAIEHVGKYIKMTRVVMGFIEQDRIEHGAHENYAGVVHQAGNIEELSYNLMNNVRYEGTILPLSQLEQLAKVVDQHEKTNGRSQFD